MDNKNIRFCNKHGETEFYYNKKYNKYICKKCNQLNVNLRKRKKKEELVAYKGGKCEICGYDKCIDALEFHHVDENSKDYNISFYLSRSIDVLKKEADKCILVCANCHREIHHEINKKKKDAQFKELNEFYELNKIERKNKINSINKEEVLLMLDSGLTKEEISKKLNVSIATLTRFFSKNGINMQRKTRSLEELREPTEEELRKMRNEGKSMKEIAKYFHHNRNYIGTICRKYNIE